MKDFKTEVEAKTLFCPFMTEEHALTDPAVAAGHISGTKYPKPATSRCLAAKCMAWRWSHQDMGPTDMPTGYCGAAGLPKYI